MRVALVFAALVFVVGCGSSHYGAGKSDFEGLRVEGRPPSYPGPAPTDLRPADGSHVLDAAISCAVGPCFPASGGATPNVPSIDQIRGQVVVERHAGADVLPFVVVNLLRDGKVVGTTKTDVAGKFAFGKVERARYEVALASSRHEAHSNVTVGFGTAEVFLVARPLPSSP